MHPVFLAEAARAEKTHLENCQAGTLGKTILLRKKKLVRQQKEKERAELAQKQKELNDVYQKRQEEIAEMKRIGRN